MYRICLSIFLLLALAACTAQQESSLTTPPNILVIMADDMGYSDIGCYGSEIATPHLDCLAQNGIRFRSFYNATRCCPSRATRPLEFGISRTRQPMENKTRQSLMTSVPVIRIR